MNTLKLVDPVASKLPPRFKLTDSQAAELARIVAWLTDPAGVATGVLLGNAGTGKTTLLYEVVAALIGEGVNVAVCAPTHKALNVLREKLAGLAVGFATIHSLIGYKMEEQDDGTLAGTFGFKGANNIREYDVVVCDECSMLDRPILDHLGKVRPHKTRILFVGDPAQLPPVTEGDDIAGLSPVFEMVDKQFRLTEIVRQAADNPIIRIASTIRDAQATLGRVSIEQIAQAAANSDGRAGLMAHDFDAIVRYTVEEIKAGTDARIVAFTNKRVIAYNEAIHAELFGIKSPSRFAAGERVIVQETGSGFLHHEDSTIDDAKPIKRALPTNEELEILRWLDNKPREHPKFKDIPCEHYIMKRASGELLHAIVPLEPIKFDAHLSDLFMQARANKDKAYSREAWAKKKSVLNMRHAYAITSHKSQGSTFHTVFVDWADMSRIRDNGTFNRALYVAATRASTHLAIAA